MNLVLRVERERIPVRILYVRRSRRNGCRVARAEMARAYKGKRFVVEVPIHGEARRDSGGKLLPGLEERAAAILAWDELKRKLGVVAEDLSGG